MNVLNAKKTFVETFDTIYYHRHIGVEKIHLVLQSQSEGVSLRGIARLSGLAYNTIVSIIRQASQKAQRIHNQEVKSVVMKCGRSWKKQKNSLPTELESQDCWIGVSIADNSGLILAVRVGKYTDE
ncbi:hypothetical protein [Synechococcus sp. PCC 7502]|uniref:hypothetical protein n=1 Tax=Synechococcus sp. PCC 7502 TaxID=1173263 RepID=UPI0009DAF293|nr:hypothetical protein [Synechococcus sp. PCC 7502]